jgi:hypothetical protein
MSSLPSTEMELSYSAYQARQREEITRSGLLRRAALVRRGEKFRFRGGVWQPMPYQGHAVVCMAGAHAANTELIRSLAQMQNLLTFGLGNAGALYCLPADSFHQTIANTLSAERYRTHVLERGLESEYPGAVAASFDDFPVQQDTSPVELEMIGLSIFGTAIGMLGVFPREDHFERVIGFRDLFYDHERVATLGIRRTRPFIGHITIAYVETELSDDDRALLVDTIEGINRSLGGGARRFIMERAELRAYDHLAEFKALKDLPTYRL